MVLADGMVCAVFFSVLNLGYGAVIMRVTLVSAGVSTLGGAGYSTLCDGDVCTTLGGAPCLFMWD